LLYFSIAYGASGTYNYILCIFDKNVFNQGGQ